MEFMDHCQQALLIQFWFTIETFKDPLGVIVESDLILERPHETAQLLPLNTIMDDVRMVHDLYFLSYDIARLANKIQKLQSEEVMLEVLSRKADLTGDVAELRLLSCSKASLAKEIRELSFQKTQCEIQEKENHLDPDHTCIFISSSVTTEMERKHVVCYLIEVQQLNPDSKPIFG